MSKLGWRKLHIHPKETKMGSIIGHKLDYNAIMGKCSSFNPKNGSIHKNKE